MIPSQRGSVGKLLNLVRIDRLLPGMRVIGVIRENRYQPWGIERIVKRVYPSKATEGKHCIKWQDRPFVWTYPDETWLNVVLDESTELRMEEILREVRGEADAQ